MSAAAQADVGVIPYDATEACNKYASPNKLSQYMAAGLPILTTELDFVASLVRSRDLGAVFSFSARPSLTDAVRMFVDDRIKLRQQSQRAREFFLSSFNWEAVSKEFYANLDVLVGTRMQPQAAREPLDFAWIGAGRTMTRSVRPAPAPPPPEPAPVHTELVPLKVLGLIPHHWRQRIRRRLPEKVVSAIIAQL